MLALIIFIMPSPLKRFKAYEKRYEKQFKQFDKQNAQKVAIIKDMVEKKRKELNIAPEGEVELPVKDVLEALNMGSLEDLSVWLNTAFQISAFLDSGVLCVLSCK